jgi:hypothetical protein
LILYLFLLSSLLSFLESAPSLCSPCSLSIHEVLSVVCMYTVIHTHRIYKHAHACIHTYIFPPPRRRLV